MELAFIKGLLLKKAAKIASAPDRRNGDTNEN